MKRALAVLLLLTACGGGSDVEPQSQKDRYLAGAEALCEAANRKLAEVKKTPPAGAEALATYVDAVLDVARNNVQALGTLTPPADDAAALESKVLAPLRGQVEVGDQYAKDVRAAVAAKDNAAIVRLATTAPTETKADLAFMKEYGFKQCVTAADTANAAK